MVHVDFETFCHLDVSKTGPPPYARHPSCEVLMMAYCFGEGDIKLWVPEGPHDYGSFPRKLLRYIERGGLVCAHNVEFEENIFRHVLGIHIPFENLRDTAVLSLTHGFPISLDGASKAIGLEVEKDPHGKALIRKFCQPRKPTKNNPLNRWDCYSAPEEWEEFCGYCINDVVVERKIWNALAAK